MDKDKIKKMVEQSRKDGDFDEDWAASQKDTEDQAAEAMKSGELPDQGHDGT